MEIYIWHAGMVFSYHKVFKSLKALLMAYLSLYSFFLGLGLLLTLSLSYYKKEYFSIRKAKCFFWLCSNHFYNLKDEILSIWNSELVFQIYKLSKTMYIENEVSWDNCTQVCVLNGSGHPTCFPSDKGRNTFYLSLATIDTWFLDLDLDILLTESYERSIW